MAEYKGYKGGQYKINLLGSLGNSHLKVNIERSGCHTFDRIDNEHPVLYAEAKARTCGCHVTNSGRLKYPQRPMVELLCFHRRLCVRGMRTTRTADILYDYKSRGQN